MYIHIHVAVYSIICCLNIADIKLLRIDHAARGKTARKGCAL